jgi:hypothetical protein
MILITLVCNLTTSRYKGDDMPRVRVTRDEQSFLYDNRAQHSCMPYKASKRIYGPAKLEKLPEKGLHIKSIAGNDMGYKGTYLVPMQIPGRKVIHDLVVLDKEQDKILGIDFIQ